MRGVRYSVLAIAIAAVISACSGAGVSGTAGSSGYPGGVYDQEVTLTAGTVG